MKNETNVCIEFQQDELHFTADGVGQINGGPFAEDHPMEGEIFNLTAHAEDGGGVELDGPKLAQAEETAMTLLFSHLENEWKARS